MLLRKIFFPGNGPTAHGLFLPSVTMASDDDGLIESLDQLELDLDLFRDYQPDAEALAGDGTQGSAMAVTPVKAEHDADGVDDKDRHGWVFLLMFNERAPLPHFATIPTITSSGSTTPHPHLVMLST